VIRQSSRTAHSDAGGDHVLTPRSAKLPFRTVCGTASRRTDPPRPLNIE